MTVDIRIGDCRDILRAMPDESVHCVVTSPPYWGLRDYGVAGQIGMEPSLGEHLTVMVEVFREVRRVLRKDGTCWVNYGDCYATTPNGRSAADTKAAGGDDRTFRDKPFSTVGPIYVPAYEKTGRVGKTQNGGHLAGAHGGRVTAAGLLKPKDLVMMSNRLAIALQDDGWWVRSEIVWHKPNPMPESIKDRPATAHEKLWLLTKSERYWYDAAAVAEPVTASTIERVSQPGWSQQAGSTRQPGKTNGPMKAVVKGRGKETDPQARPPNSRPHTGLTAADERGRAASRSGNKERKYGDSVGRPPSGSNQGRSIPWEGSTRNLRNVWTIPTAAFSEAHFATFPPALVEPCIKAGCPRGGVVLDPFGGAGTVGLVAEYLDRNSILLELNAAYAEIARNRILLERQAKVIGMPAPKMRGLPLLDAIEGAA